MKYKINNQEIWLLNTTKAVHLIDSVHKLNELIIALGTPTEEKKESLIGKKIKGFKFEDNKYINFNLISQSQVGKVGVIAKLEDTLFRVNFENDIHLYYPASEIEKHILPDDYVEWSVEGLKKGDEYWTVDICGNVTKFTWRNDEIDKWRKTIGQIFETQQDAINYKESIINK